MSEPTAPAAPEPLRALDVPMRRIVELAVGVRRGRHSVLRGKRSGEAQQQGGGQKP